MDKVIATEVTGFEELTASQIEILKIFLEGILVTHASRIVCC